MEILNRQAKFNYFIEDTLEVGISLSGTEIKSIREGKVNIKDSYAIIKNHELYFLILVFLFYELVIFLFYLHLY